MAYTPYGYQQYGMQTQMQPPMTYGQPMQDQLAQLRQMQQAQPMPAQMPMQQMMPTQQQPDMLWVQGEAAAKSYMVANGCRAVLWDSESQTIYIKSVDGNGIPSMKVLEYNERAEAPQTASGGRRRAHGDFVTRAEFDALAAKLDSLMKGDEASGESAV